MPFSPVTASDHVRGPANAPLTIVQYGDYDCPHTRRSTAIVHDLERALDVPVRFVFRHFPLRHMHANAQLLSEIAEAAAELGHDYWLVHERLMSHRQITQEAVLADLAAAKLDVEAIQQRLGSKAIVDRVEADVVSGKASGVHSTPTWFFNGALWDGHYDADTLRSRIEDARKGTRA